MFQIVLPHFNYWSSHFLTYLNVFFILQQGLLYCSDCFAGHNDRRFGISSCKLDKLVYFIAIFVNFTRI